LNQATEKSSRAALNFPGWVESSLGVLQFLLLTAGFAVLTVGCLALMHAFTRSADFLGFALIAPVFMLSIALHEYGHVLGARLMGMTPYLMLIGPLQMSKRRTGWRVRFKRSSSDYAGMVMAFVNPHARLRGQYFGMLVAGPGMNLIIALVAAAAALLVAHPEFSAFLWGVAGFNLLYALVNLVPRRKRLASDGRQILELWRGFDEDSPAAAFARICGLSVKGVTADSIPVELSNRLAGEASPYPLFHTLFAMNAFQAQGQWTQVAALDPVLEGHVAALSPEHATGFESLIGLLRCELAFSKAMAGQVPDAALDAQLGSDYDWTIPGFRPRLQALAAVRQGDFAHARSLLQQSERHMDQSIDKAFRVSEAKIRKAIADQISR
jgi:Zn-dependent protease